MARVALIGALFGAALGVAVSAVGGAEAQVPGEAVTVVDPIDIPPETDPLARAWDLPEQRGGLYLRGSFSVGVHNTRLGGAPWESDFGSSANGFGTGFGLDLGGFVAPWAALHLDATLGALWSGALESDLGIEGGAALDEDARILAYGFGPAVTFFTPHHFYFKPAFGVGFATIQALGDSSTTKPGFYMHLVAGKDLIVRERFSLGLQFEIGYMRLKGKDERVGGVSSASLVSADARVRQFLFGLSFAFDSI